MANSPTSPYTAEPNSKTPKPENADPQWNQPNYSSSTQSTSVSVNPDPIRPPPHLTSQPPQLIQPYTHPSFPSPVPVPTASLFSRGELSPVRCMIYGGPSGTGTSGMYMPPVVMPYSSPPGRPPNPAIRSYLPSPTGLSQGTFGVIPAISYPSVPGLRGPIMPQVVLPVVTPSGTPTEKPPNTVYISKIASTVENEFVLSLLQLCGPVKSWIRAQDPTSGIPYDFGGCEFYSAEGILRALRLLSELNVDGQELALNVSQTTREHLELYGRNKREDSNKLKATRTEGAEKEESAPGAVNSQPPEPFVEDTNKDDNVSENKEIHNVSNFCTVADEDREADREALEMLTSMLEERFKTRPPPLGATDYPGNCKSELPVSSKDRDFNVDVLRTGATKDRNDDKMTSDNKPTSEHERPETSSPDRGRELNRYKRERDEEPAIIERVGKLKIQDADRRYRPEDSVSRETEREQSWKLQKEQEKERESKGRWEIVNLESETDDGDTRKRKHKSSLSEERRKRLMKEEEERPYGQNVLDNKQLVDMIPRTKEKLFSYKIDWAVFDKNELHERIKPSIVKLISQILGDNETDLVEFIVTATHEHVEASDMLKRLQGILDHNAEKFVVDLWFNLVLEIKKVDISC